MHGQADRCEEKMDWGTWDESEAAEKLGEDGRQVLQVLEKEGDKEVVGPAHIRMMNQGKWEFAYQDFYSVFGRERADELERAAIERVRRALALRENLINMKKVYLHLLKQSQAIERQLSQFTTMFFWDGKDWCQHLKDRKLRHADHHPWSTGADIYIKSSGYFQFCKGLSSALHTSREFTKRVCCIPRHILRKSDIVTRNTPDSFGLYYLLREIKASHSDLMASHEWEAVDLGYYAYNMTDEDKPGIIGGDLSAREAFDAFLLEIQSKCGFDDQVLYFVKRVLIGRGMAKAIRIEVEAARLRTACEKSAGTIATMQTLLKSKFDEDDFEFFNLMRPLQVLDGLHKVVVELARWLGVILDNPERLWFNAGDWDSANAGVVLPVNFGVARDCLNEMQAFMDEHQPLLAERLQDREGPYKCLIVGRISCAQCKLKFSKSFVEQRGLCYFCERRMRDQAKEIRDQALASGQVGMIRCPIQLRCQKQKAGLLTMCPHSLRCVVCDAWGCENCSVLRYAGEESLNYIQDFQPSILFLDFDRTLASTRTGSSPLATKDNMVHTVDPHLKEAAIGVRNTHVVTRNGFQRDIQVFLEMNGLGHVQVHSLKRMSGNPTKAFVMQSLMGPQDRAVFVDDSYQEVLDPDLRSMIETLPPQSFKTILFART